MDTAAYQYIGTYVPVHWYMSNARKVQNCEGMLITQPQLAVTYGTQGRVNRDVVVYQSICGFLQQDLCPHTRTVCRTSVPTVCGTIPRCQPEREAVPAYSRVRVRRLLSMTKSIKEQGENKVKSKQKMIK